MESTGWEATFDSLMRIAQQNVPTNDGDYIGEDGLLYCGKCHTRKQTRVELDIGGKTATRTPPVLCSCERKERERKEQEKQQAEKLEAIKKLKKASLIDERFYDSTFDGFSINQHNGRQHKIAMRYVEQFDVMKQRNQGLLFYGQPGTGKTFAAACIANYLLERKVPVVMTSFVKILALNGALNQDDETIITRMNNADLLVIDDLGAERGTDFALERVYNFVDSRYRTKKPMILTSNLTIDEIKETNDIRYKRIYDRVLQCCYPVEFTGPSWRRKEAGARFNSMKELLEG